MNKHSSGPTAKTFYGTCRICQAGVTLADFKLHIGRVCHRECVIREKAKSAGQVETIRMYPEEAEPCDHSSE